MFCNNGAVVNELGDLLYAHTESHEELLSYLQIAGETICENCRCEIQSFDGPGDSACGMLILCRHLLCAECFKQCTSKTHGITSEEQIQCPTCDHNSGIRKFVAGQASGSTVQSLRSTYTPTKLLRVVEILKQQDRDRKRCVRSTRFIRSTWIED